MMIYGDVGDDQVILSHDAAGTWEQKGTASDVDGNT
jgi:hypothetical protein